MFKSIKSRLVVTIASLGLALALVVACGVTASYIANQKIQVILHDSVHPLTELKAVSDMYAVNIVDTAWKTRTGQISWAQGRQNVQAARSRIAAAWKDYTSTEMSAAERRLANEVQARMNGADKAVSRLGGVMAAEDQAGLEDFTTHQMYSAIDPVTDKVSKLVDLQLATAEADGQAAARARTLFTSLMAIVALLSLGSLVLGFNTVLSGVSRPLAAMTGVMRRLAGGDHAVDVPAIGRGDEIGDMAKAVLTFKENAVERLRLEAEAAAFQQKLDTRLREMEAAFKASGLEQQKVVDAMGRELLRLAKGDLAARLDEAVAEDYRKLQNDFNSAVSQLQQAMVEIANSTATIHVGTSEISEASDGLSRRTEQQAASLEETAAALDEITATVRRTAQGADNARCAVSQAREEAERSGQVVRSAVEAMGQIEASAKEITQIIGVIDEIAFQTNLLALNAGVEAARAGDAGRGFAVVASEVRALAQRSAEAAKEIKALISTSSSQVKDGVELVGQTGVVLDRIASQVLSIDRIVGEIAASAQEQSSALEQVNSAVNQMDQMTQQNAAMVEETTAAGHSLRHEAKSLSELMGRFDLGRSTPQPRLRSPVAVIPKASPQPLSRGATALKMQAVADAAGWEEF